MPMLNSYDDAIKAGQYQQQGAGEQIGNWLGNLPAQMDKEQERQLKKQEEQVKLYTDLRNAGYSSEEAHSRLTRTFAPTQFLQNFLSGGKDTGMQAPAEDVFATKRAKEKLELEKMGAEIGELKGKEKYYREGGSYRRSDSDGWTPAQLQARLSFLSDNPDQAEEGEIEEISAKIRGGLGINKKGPKAPRPMRSKYQVGQTVTLKNGKTVTIKSVRPDGTMEY